MIRCSVRIAKINIQFDQEMKLIHFGTEAPTQHQIGLGLSHEALYGFSIKGHC
jgi:hypothetical protein